MSFEYQFAEFINLHVEDRIHKQDALRQARTVKAILQRLQGQPGVILADEVGMGKTFVALAVAVSVFLKEKKPAVVMIPPNLINKWPNDFRLFREACVADPDIKAMLKCGVAKKPEEFLKLIDDKEERRSAVVFLTHGALSRNMSDGWIKLAIIQRALYKRWDTEEMYKSLGRYAGALLEMQYVENRNRQVDIWDLLLRESPEKWKKHLVKYGFFTPEDDDPVPLSFLQELKKTSSSELNRLYENLRARLPRRHSDSIKQRLAYIRQLLTDEARVIWTRCLSKIRLDLPLLIFDEAHHLKNAQTQLVTKLFRDSDTEKDAGILTSQFDRMLFLTATPFQLGHKELCSVLDRFAAIHWATEDAPSMSRQAYEEELKNLLKQLDQSQLAARKLDHSWGKLVPEDLTHDGVNYVDVFHWWQAVSEAADELPPRIQQVIEDYRQAREKLKGVEPLLRKYVIRHLKSKEMSDPYPGVPRRQNLPGSCIRAGAAYATQQVDGLEVTREAILPFLLASRLTVLQQDQRPVFAEGLASSYQAFRDTRQKRMAKSQESMTDIDDDPDVYTQEKDLVSLWYLEQLDQSLDVTAASASHHPKVRPTVEKAIELWSKGAKVLIFCHYKATGRALRQYLSQEMKAHICRVGAVKFSCTEGEVFDHIERIAARVTDQDSPLHRQVAAMLNRLLDEFPALDEYRERLIDTLLRYMKTPSFLVRFASDLNLDRGEQWVQGCFAAQDDSGQSLMEMIRTFLAFLVHHEEDRSDYIEALLSLQPGGIRARDMISTYQDDKLPEDQDNIVMANVRLCNGETTQKVRQKLMKTFNTPFFPDILISSSVMAEGVDLHLNCRHIIHHDLCWNPSTLEQRTGRVDRIGAKAEKCGKSIQVYLPYLKETQDEKMYRVVMERERWFNIIMGDKYKVDAAHTDKIARRIPLPEELSRELSFDLQVAIAPVKKDSSISSSIVQQGNYSEATTV